MTINVGNKLEIVEHGVILASWEWHDIRRLEMRGESLRLTAITAPDLARLDISDTLLKQRIASLCPVLERASRPTRSAQLRTVALVMLMLISVAGLLWFGIPYVAARVAPAIPIAWEKRLGDVADAQIGKIFPGKTCGSRAGTAALNTLMGRLTEKSDLPYAPTITVIRSDVPNAFALPGGKIYLLEGLLARANSPDEIAGVLAHELGHLRHRDHLRRLVANGGTAYVVGLFFGDVAGAGALLFATRELLGAAYSRETESNADHVAAEIMAQLHRSPVPMGELLLRIEKSDDGGAIGLLRDHPLSASRLTELKKLDTGNHAPPLLTNEEWAALKTICG